MQKYGSVYLKQLTISGFKSFATKTVLDFEPDIMAIVGPNGSGKSNIADAIRWALGEQSGKHLRLKKSEEVVFAGTHKRARASMAEVSLLLDNSDGGMAIDFSEIVLSRVLYRSGESEYRLNGRKIRLAEVQQLLVQSGFGPNSYAVIGQGMIDGFILATPSERKLLFDEASGIRQYEIKREQAIKKLSATDANLVRARDIVAELEPRLKTLERSVEATKEHQLLKQQVAELRRQYIQTANAYYLDSEAVVRFQLKELDMLIIARTNDIQESEKEKEALADKKASPQEGLTRQLSQLEIERDELANSLSVKKAELQMLKEKASEEAQVQKLSTRSAKSIQRLESTQESLNLALVEAQRSEQATTGRLDEITRQISQAQARLTKLRRESDETSRQEYVVQALAILKQVAYGMSNGSTHEQLRLLVYKAGRLLSHASKGQTDIIESIKLQQHKLNELMVQREKEHKPYTKAVIKVRSLELDVMHNMAKLDQLREEHQNLARRLQGSDKTLMQLSQRQPQISQIEQRLASISSEVASLRLQLSQQQNSQLGSEAIFALAAQLEAARTELTNAQEKRKLVQQTIYYATEEMSRVNARAKEWFGSATALSSPVNGKIATAAGLEALERELAILSARVKDGSGADSEAAEEFSEASKRYTFMNEQIVDLERAGLDLASVTGQLDELIKARFQSAFAGITEHFSGYFEQLFGGGKASLVLRPDTTGVYGIEIKAVPPGKRVESLATLSGGERALVGIALLAAILTVNPSPFVVLDEVDAALDEANSARLAKILKVIAKKSQLLVITHNRSTMASAKSIFGVTMSQHHTSRILSMRLEDARELVVRSSI